MLKLPSFFSCDTDVLRAMNSRQFLGHLSVGFQGCMDRVMPANALSSETFQHNALVWDISVCSGGAGNGSGSILLADRVTPAG